MTEVIGQRGNLVSRSFHEIRSTTKSLHERLHVGSEDHDRAAFEIAAFSGLAFYHTEKDIAQSVLFDVEKVGSAFAGYFRRKHLTPESHPCLLSSHMTWSRSASMPCLSSHSVRVPGHIEFHDDGPEFSLRHGSSIQEPLPHAAGLMPLRMNAHPTHASFPKYPRGPSPE